MLAPKASPLRLKARVPLSIVDATVSARLGTTRVSGNAQPAAFNRQVAMYLAKHVGGWSTTRIGKFYNGRDHSTVCYAIKRIGGLREVDSDVDALLNSLMEEIRSVPAHRTEAYHIPECGFAPMGFPAGLEEEFLDALADRIAQKLLSRRSERAAKRNPTGTG